MAAETGALSVQQREKAAGRIVDTTPATREGPQLPEWISGAWAALQAFIWSFLIIVIPSVAAFVGGATSGTTNNTWRTAVSSASDFWLLAHGGPLETSVGVIAFVPLGLSIIAILTCFGSVRRSLQPSIGALASYLLSYLVLAVLLAATMGSDPASTALGALLISAIGAGLALRGVRGRPLHQRLAEVLNSLPPWAFPSAEVRLGMRVGVTLFALLVVVSAVLFGVWAVAGRSTSGDVLQSLSPDAVGGVVLVLAQAVIAINMICWALSWLMGPGFSVGAGTAFSPGEAILGPLPAMPVLGALPAGGMASSALMWVLAVVPVAVLILTISLWRRLQRLTDTAEVPWRSAVAAGSAFVLTASALVGGLMAASGGSAGPGRLREVGPDALAVAMTLALYTSIGVVLVCVLGHPATWRSLRCVGAIGWTAVRGSDSTARSNTGEEPAETSHPITEERNP